MKILTVIDDYTRQALAIEVHRAISGAHVTRILDRIALFRGYPSAIRTDQGPEFTGKALDYNELCPHFSLGQLPPNAFAAANRLSEGTTQQATVIQLRTN